MNAYERGILEAIEYEGPHSMVVSSLVPLTSEQVRSYVGSGWYLPKEWRNITGGWEAVYDNPRYNEDKKLWLWLLMRKDE